MPKHVRTEDVAPSRTEMDGNLRHISQQQQDMEERMRLHEQQTREMIFELMQKSAVDKAGRGKVLKSD